MQDGLSRLQALRTCEIVGARGLVIEPGFGILRSLRELEARRHKRLCLHLSGGVRWGACDLDAGWRWACQAC